MFTSPSSHIDGCLARRHFGCVVLSDGTVLVMGGYNGNYMNDVWKSRDGGVSWILATANPGWTGNLARLHVKSFLFRITHVQLSLPKLDCM